MRLLILAPYPTAKGPMPKIVDLLIDALRGEGMTVAVDRWGGRGETSSARARLRELASDIVRVRRTVARERPDVVLVETAFDWKCLARDAALAAAIRSRRRRTVLQFHGSRSDRLAAPGDRAFKAATRVLLALTDGVLVLSSQEQRELAAFDQRGRFYVVANPVVAPQPPPPARGPQAHPPTVLFVARLLPEKGVLDLLEAFALLNGRIPSRLLIAGDGPLSGQLRERVEELDLGARVTLAGRLGSERLAEAYGDADVFALPTYHPEGFPTSISEAMSSGLPIVATATRGIADHLEAETNVLFVPPRDPAALAAALERLLADPALRARMGRANLETVRSFAPERVVGAYVRALAEIAAG